MQLLLTKFLDKFEVFIVFYCYLFFILTVICLLGIFITVPRIARTAFPNVRQRLEKKNKPIPSLQQFIKGSIIQSLFVVIIMVLVGMIFAKQVNFHAPFFTSIFYGKNIIANLYRQIMPAIFGGIGGGLILIAAYYFVFIPILDEQTIKSMYSLRMKTGFWGRVLYGGVVEEIITRWGLQSFVTWLIFSIVGNLSAGVIYSAIIIVGIVFGLLHMPAYLAAGCKRSVAFFMLAIILNLWASIIFGWLFWQYGLLAAIVAHMLFHIIWWPFDLLSKKEGNKEGNIA